ncbi:MAG: M1 family metallopeptidase [Thaumarchaeota archaeon]|nr:M1 family metallopeptidase [Nitrososphaerota archaeon]
MDIAPKNYKLVFEPDLEKFTFDGTAKITIECKKATDTIIVNSAELDIKSCLVYAKKDIPCTITLHERKEILQIKLDEKIKGIAHIDIKFQGILNDKLLGFYRSKYTQGSKTKYLATTQFEAADARRAFPCWDEPKAKATFDITIIAQNKYDTISNMPVKSKKRMGNKTAHTFAKTPVMSTYLVYLGVGEFEYLRGKAGKTTIRIVTTKGNKSKAKFSLDMGKKLLVAYEKYFGIRYPLPKLDLIAVPDFAAGAMENWGAITFRETILLYDPRTSSTRTRQFIAEVISHEIAHQWFGNLVTMEWWNDLWLNESFATFMATKFVDKFYPEWDMWSQFIESDMNAAMKLDSLKSTHPIDVKVNAPAEIREIFDAISYDKGGCILRMLEHYVGEPSFRKGLRQYLKDFKYGNATGQDLWKAIGKAARMPVKQMVNLWLTQPGFPLVDITRKGSKLYIKQQRYLQNPDSKPSNTTWHIPLTIGESKTIAKKMITHKSATIHIPSKTVGFVANYGRYGFYRVRYDASAILDLKMLVDQKKIPAIDRWAVQNDLYSLCISGHENVRNYLDFSDAYYNDENYLVSVNVASNLAGLYFRTFYEEIAEIQAHSLNYFRHLLSRLGMMPKKTDSHTDALLRPFVLSVLGRMNDEQITESVAGMYEKFRKLPKSLPADLVEPVCSITSWGDSPKVYSQLKSMYENAKTTEEKLRYLGAMCGFKNSKLLKKTLDYSLTPSVRSQNIQLPIMKVAANPYGRKVLWPWLVKHWDMLGSKVGHGNPLFNRIVGSISQVADHTMEGEIKKFFRENPAPGTERTQAQVIERIRINSAFLKSVRREFRGN